MNKTPQIFAERSLWPQFPFKITDISLNFWQVFLKNFSCKHLYLVFITLFFIFIIAVVDYLIDIV